MTTDERNEGKATLVVLASGERLELRGEDDRGVHTDAGTHPWEEVLAYHCWSEQYRRWSSVPR